jgi:enoyl-CoA hydratase
MDFSNYKAILFRREGKVLYATFNRPETLNAVDPDMHGDLDRLFKDVTEDDQTKVLVISGAGRAFSAGGDIEQMQKIIDDPNLFLSDMAAAKRLVFSILDCPKPIVAKLNGHAIGLGATLALFSDFVIAANHAKIADPHVSVGFTAGDGGAVIWPHLIGYMRAKQYLLTGDAITGEEAAKIGLITKAVAAEDLDRVVDELAQRVANGAAKAIQWTKLSINIGLRQLASAALEASLAYEALSNTTQDHREAVQAFREKRPPKFTGQ